MNAQQDLIEAIRDAAALRAGIISAKAAHPDAHLLASGDSNLLKELAVACVPKDRQGGNQAGVFGYGVSTQEFKNSLSVLLKSATVGKLTAQARHRAFCDLRKLKSFQPHDFPRADLDMELFEIPEGRDPTPEMAVFDSPGVTAAIRTWGRNITISRQVIANDDVELLAGIAGNSGANASRLEGSLVYDMLESNPTLGDGENLFDAGHGNVCSVAFDSAGLAAGLSELKNQRTPAGIPSDLDAAYLVVEPALELAAKTLTHQAGMDAITVIAAASLPIGRWYLFASPSVSPVIALLHLEGVKDGVTIGPVPNRDDAATDGVKLGIRFDVGCAIVGRVGVVRGGA
jgi:hypothetical protein